MTVSLKRISLAALLAGCLVLSAGACSDDTAGATLDVTGTNDGCDPAMDVLDAGTTDVEFTNEADKISELYVLRSNGDIVGEVENVTTGTKRTLTVDLVAGEYTLRCRPGQTGDGVTSVITVAGEGGTAAGAPDRTLTFEAVDFQYTDLDLSEVTVGETIRFDMTNSGTEEHEFEVLDPDGNAIGEVAAVEPGGTGGATITFDAPGDYSFQCILVNQASGQPHSMLGMKGTFSVG